ncbi:MAG: host-nuclease inhibitor Gam family protein [Chitinophagaceae bacterium]
MSKTRVKKQIITGMITREMADDAFAEYADSDAWQQKLTAQMDVQITKIREKYSDELQILQEVKDAAFEQMQAYATDNRDQFGNRKSMEFSHGVLGFRTGTPKLKTKKGFTWPSVTNLLKTFLPAYVRISEEPAKDRLLADREDPAVSQLFDKVGIYIDQDESFYVELKKEEIAI